MEFCRILSAGYLLLLIELVMVMAFMASSVQAYTFYVGGREGWVLSPYESYNHWAERNRFQVNDTLVFKFKGGEDSVLLVKEEDFDACDVNNPIKKMDDGESVFKFDRPGPFYFISGVPRKCRKSQKLHIWVLSPRTRPLAAAVPPFLPPSPAPTSTSRSPAPSPAHLIAGRANAPSPAASTVRAPSDQAVSPSGWFGEGISPAPSPASMAPEPVSSSTILSLSMTNIGLIAVILVGAFVG